MASAVPAAVVALLALAHAGQATLSGNSLRQADSTR